MAIDRLAMNQLTVNNNDIGFTETGTSAFENISTKLGSAHASLNNNRDVSLDENKLIG